MKRNARKRDERHGRSRHRPTKVFEKLKLILLGCDAAAGWPVGMPLGGAFKAVRSVDWGFEFGCQRDADVDDDMRRAAMQAPPRRCGHSHKH